VHCILRPRKEIRRIGLLLFSLQLFSFPLQRSSLHTPSRRQLFCSSVKVTVMSFASDKRFGLVDRGERNTTLGAKGEALCVMSATHWTPFRRLGIILFHPKL
jgi:hypothetical protein